ncbi:hypothetical protein V5799_011613 [Amblyomma americanum]|uniref:ZN622/Rei1/Reh1 zinc finger C2H2-type domain-containing protein n=1 Tax=Amblyomma americanum TaxID=6943 RepID=A0AAQ4EGR2_AMBAM
MPWTNRAHTLGAIDAEGNSDEDDSDWESIEGEGDMDEEELEDEEEDMEDDAERVPPTECLFCGQPSESVEANVAHMSLAHSFFIPDTEYLVDVEGLLTYLGYKLGVGKLCLWCSKERSPYQTVHAARQHMRDKGHCKMAQDGVDGLMEYSDFYDYTASYPEGEGDEGGDASEEVDLAATVLDSDGWQLVLPSGAVAGHRSLARYYRQNLPAVASKSGDSAKRILSQYRALGWTGATSREVAQQKARDIRFIQTVRAKRNMQLGCKANKLQKHFRPQVLF